LGHRGVRVDVDDRALFSARADAGPDLHRNRAGVTAVLTVLALVFL
jgi:hypothetical protein